MKRVVFIFMILGVCFMSGCSANKFDNIEIGDSTSSVIDFYGEPYIKLNTINIYKDEEQFVGVVSDFKEVLGVVLFTADRKLLYSEGLKPIACDDKMEQFIGKSIDEIEEEFGEIHCDIGSGFFIPAYITDHATILIFQIENEFVINASSIDIVTNMKSEFW